ncbi:NnrS family protein [Rhodobacteraceae bacterium NNCM2]|nr:NnrS family protein [Coraliihabitans acroporae]
MATTSEQMRAWRGPAVLTFGFRPFFLGAALWAAFGMVVWILILSGMVDLPTRFDPVSWHAHEFLFGYLGAVIAGFLLTAVPNWTGRLPVVGWPLGGLFLLWLAGRIAIALSTYLQVWLVMVVDLSMPVALIGFLAREILRGENWRNLVVLGMLIVFTLGNLAFHIEAAQVAYAGGGIGLRVGLAAGIMMISVIGGRIIPSFTRNWLVKRGETRLPSATMQPLDRVALRLLLAGLTLWVILPTAFASGIALIAVGLVHSLRLGRWAGSRCLAEPLVCVLHAAYGFVPLGALMLGASILWPETFEPAGAQHVWMAGAIGLMTLAVMTRATLGHTGRDLTAGPGTLGIYLCLVGAVLARLLASVTSDASPTLLTISGIFWIAAFGGFAALYGPMLLGPRSED